ncbi:hypothetical protein ACFQZ4_43255 [Catellatospora coxensis]
MTLYSVPKAPDPPREERGPLRVRTHIAEGNLVMRRGLRGLLEANARISIVGETGADADALRNAGRLSPDVIVLGLDSRHRPLEQVPPAPEGPAVLVLADTDDSYQVHHALRLGVTSYLVHGQFDADDLVDAVLSTARRQPWLSPSVLAGIVESFQTGPGPRRRRAPRGPTTGSRAARPS